MHISSMLRMAYFVKRYVREAGINNNLARITVLDVGSYDVNGSYRLLFSGNEFEYTGLDIAKGPNVDYVPSNPYMWSDLTDNSFDIVVSGQALEHIEFPWLTMQEMTRVLKIGGYMCVVAPNGFGEHRHPIDCYRFFADGMIALARYVNLTVIHASTNCAPPNADLAWYSTNKADSFLIARKDSDFVKFDPQNYYFELPQRNKALTGFIPLSKR